MMLMRGLGVHSIHLNSRTLKSLNLFLILV
jgi:hypothetical protein